MKKIYILLVILAAIFLIACTSQKAPGNQNTQVTQNKEVQSIEVELYTDGNYAEVEVSTNKDLEKLTLQTANKDQIIQQLATKYGLTTAQVSSITKFEEEEENEEQEPRTGTTPSTGTAPNTIEITSSGFNPKTLTVDVGDTVTFVNKDTTSHWPASNPHPIHTGYPESGGCIGSKFDACEGLANGETFSFTFDQEGNWNYHDHMHTSLTGTIVVE